MAETIADLVVKMDVESAKFRAEIDKANNKLSDFEKKLEAIKNAAETALAIEIAKVAAEGVQKLAAFVMAGADAADQIDDLSQVTGIAAGEIALLGYIATTTGGSADSLTTGFMRLEKSMAEASKTNDEQRAAFRALGVEYESSPGKLRPVGEVFEEIASKISGYKDGAAKAALVQAIFGKGAAELIPILNDVGERGLAGFRKEADQMGSLLQDHTIKAAAGFQESILKVESAGQSLAIRIAAELSPSLEALTGQFFGSAHGAGRIQNAAEVAALMIRSLASAAVVAITPIEGFGQAIGKLVAAFMGLQPVHLHAVGDMLQRLRDIWAEPFKAPSSAVEGSPDFIGPMLKKAEAPIAKSGKAIEAAIKQIDKQIEETKAKALGIVEAGQLDKMTFSEGTIALEKFATGGSALGRELAGEFKRLNQEYKVFEQKLESGQITKGLKDAGGSAKQLATEMEKARHAQDELLSAERAQAMVKIAEKGEHDLRAEIDRVTEALIKQGKMSEESAMQHRLATGEHKASLDAMRLVHRDAAADELTETAIARARALDNQTRFLQDNEERWEAYKGRLAEANQITREMQTPAEHYNVELARLNKMLAEGTIKQEQYEFAVRKARVEFAESSSIMGISGRELFGALENSLADFLVNWDQGLGNMALSFAKTLERMAAQALASGLINMIMGGIFPTAGVGGGLSIAGLTAIGTTASGTGTGPSEFSGLDTYAQGFPTAYASGGPVDAGLPILVGERGPEIFLPGSSGQIIPNHRLPSLAPHGLAAHGYGPQGGAQKVEHLHRHAFDEAGMRLTLGQWVEQWLANEVARR